MQNIFQLHKYRAKEVPPQTPGFFLFYFKYEVSAEQCCILQMIKSFYNTDELL